VQASGFRPRRGSLARAGPIRRSLHVARSSDIRGTRAGPNRLRGVRGPPQSRSRRAATLFSSSRWSTARRADPRSSTDWTQTSKECGRPRAGRPPGSCSGQAPALTASSCSTSPVGHLFPAAPRGRAPELPPTSPGWRSLPAERRSGLAWSPLPVHALFAAAWAAHLRPVIRGCRSRPRSQTPRSGWRREGFGLGCRAFRNPYADDLGPRDRARRCGRVVGGRRLLHIGRLSRSAARESYTIAVDDHHTPGSCAPKPPALSAVHRATSTGWW